MSGSPRGVRDRDVLLLMALVVAAVLGLNVVSGLIPGLDGLLSGAPVLVVALIVTTAGVLLWSVGRRSQRG